MPADFENVEEVGAHLRQLEDEAQGVNWASADALRVRGRARAHRRAVAGTTVVCLGIATLGISITGNLPGQEGFLNTTVPIAGVPTEQRTVSGNPGDEQGTDGSDPDGGTASGPGDPNTDGTDPNSPDRTDPNSPDPTGDNTASPSESVTSPPDETTPTSQDSVSPDPTDSSSPTVPTMSTAAVAAAGEFPAFDGVDGSWSEAASGDSGEGRASSTWQCDKPALSDLGAVGSAWREHYWTPSSSQSDTEAEVTDVSGAGASAAFETVDEATDGYGELAAAISDCSAGSVGSANSVSVSAGTASWWEISTDTTTHVVGLVQRGSAVAYVVLDQPAVDAAVSMDETLQATADRLADWDG